jgi:hypothetical protein
MRVTSIEMQSPTLEEPINFSLSSRNPKARYKVRAITGLDAEEIVPKFYGFGLNGDSGSKYYTFNMKPRDIVMRINLNPNTEINESYSDIRDDLYRAISSTRTGKVALYFKAGATTVSHIYGFITKFEASLFTRTPEIQLTVNCDDPMFRGINPVLYSDAELPTTNPVTIGDVYSTAPHGFEMQITYNAASPALTIQDEASSPNWAFTVTPSGGFLSGDVLHFSSEFTNKQLYLVRSSTTIELIDKISPASIWPLIFPGGSTFYFTDMTKFDLDMISYYASYWGV